MFFFRHASSRLLSAPVYLEQQLLFSVTSTRAPIISSAATLTTIATSSVYEFHTSSTLSSFNNIIIRYKHSSTQIKRLFKKNPARRRIIQKNLLLNGEEAGQNSDISIPQSYIEPVISKPKILSNGWNPPFVNVYGNNVKIPDYPFKVTRTKNKPNNSVGFLPVYSEFRKDGARVTTRIKRVSGDRDVFLNELRATLQIPIPKNLKEDSIRFRTGGTIEVKGNRVQEVKRWLASLGF